MPYIFYAIDIDKIQRPGFIDWSEGIILQRYDSEKIWQSWAA